MKKLMILMILMILTVSAHAYNSCKLTVTSNNYLGTLQNSVQSDPHDISLSTRKNSNNCKNFRVYFSTGGANNYNRKASNYNSSIPYNLYLDSGLNTVLKDYQVAGTNEYMSINLPSKNTTYTFPFYVKLVDLNSVFNSGAGYYGDQIQANIYSVKSNGSLEYQLTAYYYFQFIIPRYAELSLVPLGSAHDPTKTTHLVDFGNLTTNKTQSLSLKVKGNVGFGIYMASQNGSQLKNGNESIPYQIKVSTNNYRSLSNPGQSYYMLQRNTGTSSNSEDFPVSLKIGQIPQNPKTGDYQDVITVTVQAW